MSGREFLDQFSEKGKGTWDCTIFDKQINIASSRGNLAASQIEDERDFGGIFDLVPYKHGDKVIIYDNISKIENENGKTKLWLYSIENSQILDANDYQSYRQYSTRAYINIIIN